MWRLCIDFPLLKPEMPTASQSHLLPVIHCSRCILWYLWVVVSHGPCTSPRIHCATQLPGHCGWPYLLRLSEIYERCGAHFHIQHGCLPGFLSLVTYLPAGWTAVWDFSRRNCGSCYEASASLQLLVVGERVDELDSVLLAQSIPLSLIIKFGGTFITHKRTFQWKCNNFME